MTDDEMRAAIALANQHIAGHDRPRDEYCPECVMCHGYMETFGMNVEPSAFCDACMYTAADAMASALLTANAECERMRAVYEAARTLADRRWLPDCAEVNALIDAIDASRAGRE